MRSSERFKNAILGNMLKGIKERGITSGSISHFLERKRTIKFSADVAKALDRGPAAKWSHGIIGNHQERSVSAGAVAGDLGMVKQSYRMTRNIKKILKGRSMMRMPRMKRMRRKGGRWWSNGVSSTSRVLVKRKLQVLKQLVPGGEAVDNREVVVEALDYVISLRAQLHVMRYLTSAAELLKVFQGSVVLRNNLPSFHILCSYWY